MQDLSVRHQAIAPGDRAARRGRWAAACLAFVAGEAALRLYWIAGGRWGYTACDRTDLVDPSGGCGADRVDVVPLWQGVGAVGALAAVAVLIAYALWSPRRAAACCWTVATLLLIAAFPLHLLFEIPAGLAGDVTDWRDIGARLALVAGAAAFGGLANACGPPRGPAATEYQPVSRSTRRWGYAAAALPVIGWAVPHGLWLLGVPFGISAQELEEGRQGLSTPAGVAITVVPPLAGLLVLGLVQRWGQRFPRWMPWLRGRAVPRMLAAVPAGVVAITLVAYGLLSAAVFTGQLLSGDLSGADLRDGWAVVGTLLVFVGWGVALGVTTAGYLRATRSPSGPRDRTGRSERPPADGRWSAHGSSRPAGPASP
ncbi:hypothetical protein [Actinoplanes sp. NPDC026623]|uniref:hypothetical protein n=1 Tax=Actinoplanes sp. NPDC026623 TaxID=3155610 RepID=UPI0033C0B168